MLPTLVLPPDLLDYHLVGIECQIIADYRRILQRPVVAPGDLFAV